MEPHQPTKRRFRKRTLARHTSSVRDWMTPEPIVIPPDTPLGEAYDLMLAQDLRRLPVVDAEGELLGILTLSDVQRLIPAGERAERETSYSLTETLVQDVMVWDPLAVSPDDTIQDAAERMLEYQVSGLPVIEDRQVVGIITESDIFRLVVESWPKRHSHPSPLVHGTGWAIWLTGLPASGKTTLANALQQRLAAEGVSALILDADELRPLLTPLPSDALTERNDFYHRLTETALLLTRQGINVIIAAPGHTRAERQIARARLPHFAEVWVRCAPTICQQRDTKRRSTQVLAGTIPALPNINVPYERPEAPEATIDTGRYPPTAAAERLLAALPMLTTPGATTPARHKRGA